MSGLQVHAVQDRAGLRQWLSVPHRIFAGDPAWIPPLALAERQRLSPKAPIREFGEVALFLASRDGTPVGRISAQVNRRHLAEHRDSTGHFGFFDCQQDPQAATALVAAAAQWLGARAITRMKGPFNFTINEECGCLVENFTDPPVVMMPHARAFTGQLLEQAGLVKAMDLYSYRCSPKAPPPLKGLARAAERFPGARLRKLDLRHYDDEVRLMVEIFNDAWRGNWGFVPFGDAEARHMASEMRPALRADFGRVLLLGSEPAGIMVALPDVNGLIAGFDGRLLPFNWTRLAWDLTRRNERGARIVLLGLRRKYQSSPQAGALLALMIVDLLKQQSFAHLDWVDFGWVLENNHRMNRIAARIAGAPYKIHRLYEKALP